MITHDWNLTKENFEQRINKIALQLYKDYTENKMSYEVFMQHNKFVVSLAELNQRTFKDKMNPAYKYIVTDFLDNILKPQMAAAKFNEL